MFTSLIDSYITLFANKMYSGKYVLLLAIVLVNFISVFLRILKPSELRPKLIVLTTSGLLQGVEAGFTSGKHRTIYRFRGIPYAEPPVGVLRFEVTFYFISKLKQD